METALDYLIRKHKTLKKGYLTPDGLRIESCGQISLEVARRLFKEGKKPCILILSEPLREGQKYLKPIRPKLYGGEIIWSLHRICCCDGFVYDPLLKKPAPYRDYFELAFGEKIQIKDIIPSRDLEKTIIRNERLNIFLEKV